MELWQLSPQLSHVPPLGALQRSRKRPRNFNFLPRKCFQILFFYIFFYRLFSRPSLQFLLRITGSMKWYQTDHYWTIIEMRRALFKNYCVIFERAPPRQPSNLVRAAEFNTEFQPRNRPRIRSGIRAWIRAWIRARIRARIRSRIRARIWSRIFCRNQGTNFLRKTMQKL